MSLLPYPTTSSGARGADWAIEDSPDQVFRVDLIATKSLNREESPKATGYSAPRTAPACVLEVQFGSRL
jgi:hypothetical protein